MKGKHVVFRIAVITLAVLLNLTAVVSRDSPHVYGQSRDQSTSPLNPPSSHAPAMAYQADRQTTLLFVSPCTWDAPNQATWEYDGTTWLAKTTTSVPCLDWGYTMAHDRTRNVTVLGGLHNNYDGETWEYDGVDWHQATPVRPYPKQINGALVYDEARERLVLFGGEWCERQGCIYSDETREYTGTAWLPIATDQAPPPRAHHAMAYDGGRQVTVLFGGWAVPPGEERGTTYSDTWEYDGESWRRAWTPHYPPARAGAAMAYNPHRGVIVLFGGYDTAGNLLNDTWEYDGADWHPVATSSGVAARAGHAMVYDAARGELLLYGGHDNRPGQAFGDLWTYDGASWKVATDAQQPSAPPTYAYPYCPDERPEGAGPFYIMPITDFGQNAYGCGPGNNDWYTLCCGCQGPTNCPNSCWEGGGNQDLIDLDDMKARLEAAHSNPNVQIGFSTSVPYLGWVDDQANDFHFNENILRYMLALAVATETPIAIQLSGQQWAGSGWPGYGQLTRYLLEQNETNMHLPNPDDPGADPLPWYDEHRQPEQHISPSDINLTSPDLNWILHREFQYYKERNLKEALCWLHHFRAGEHGHLLAGVSLDTESGMSSLYAAWPNLEAYAGECEPGVPCNYNPWDKQVPFDYQDQFDYRGQYPTPCAASPSGEPQYCTGGMRHAFVDFLIQQFQGDLNGLNTEMGTTFAGWYANHRFDSPDHFGDGYSIQNNPPVCQYNVAGHEPWECVYVEQGAPVPYNQHYIDVWTTFRQKSVQTWLQRSADWMTCQGYPNEDPDAPYHLWACPYADPGHHEGCELDPAPKSFPSRLIFTHQAADPEPQEHFCSPIWTAQLEHAQVGLSAYDLQAASMASGSNPPSWDDAYYTHFFQDVVDLAAEEDDRWGFLEWNTIDWDCYDPGYDVQYQTLENLYNCGVSIVCPYHWPDAGGNPCPGTEDPPYKIRDTSLEAAIRDFVLNHPHDPCLAGHCFFLPIFVENNAQRETMSPPPALPVGYPAPPAGDPSSISPTPAGLQAYPPPPTPPPPTPTPVPTPTPGDIIPPESSVVALPPYQCIASFAVTWFGHDADSGIDQFKLQYRDGQQGQWTNWLTYPIPFFAIFEGGQDGHSYYFRSQARDHAGNVEPWPSQPDYDAVTTIDLSPPSSQVDDLIPYNAASFQVSWTGSDATSGIDHYDVQVCVDTCDDPVTGWSDWITGTTATSAPFEGGEDGHSYYFRSRAHDRAGNVEGWPQQADAHTLVDLLPPTSAVDTLPTYSGNPLPVTWWGEDSASGVADYDLQVCRIDCSLPKDAVWVDWLGPITATEAWFSGEDGPVSFRSRARDRAGHQESYPSGPDASTLIDTIPPDSEVGDLPAYSRSNFPVSWSGVDNSSGIAYYDLQVCVGDCAVPTVGVSGTWQTWLTATTDISATFVGAEHGQPYAFRSRAHDLAGNVEPLPSQADVTTTVDAIPPSSQIDPLSPYSPATFTVTWSGQDDLSGVAAYDVQVCRGVCDQPEGGWETWLRHVDTTTACFTRTTNSVTHAFRSRAYDLAGNVEPWPIQPDAQTTGDTLPPQSQVDDLAPYNPASFTVTWHGEDATSGVDSFDVQVCWSACRSPNPFWVDWLTGTTVTSMTFEQGIDGQTYYFRSRARDQVGNLEFWPLQPDTATTVDTSPPTSQVDALANYSQGTFTVTWSGEDGGSGVARYDVQVCTATALTPECWWDWLTGTLTTTARFTGTHGQGYAFRCRAYDLVGNVGRYPTQPDARTQVDTEGPQTWIDPPQSPDATGRFQLHWDGEDEPAGLASYNLYLRDESARTWILWLDQVTVTETPFTGTVGHTYHFCVRGVDRAGNVDEKDCPAMLEGWPIIAEVTASVPPTSRVETLPPTAPTNPFVVYWQGSTAGLLYDVQVMDLDVGSWQDWLLGTTVTSAPFTGEAGHTYAFRCRARIQRIGGIVEPWPWSYDTLTRVTIPAHGNQGEPGPKDPANRPGGPL